MNLIFAYIVVVFIWSTTPLAVKLSVSEGATFAPLVARTVIGLVITLVCLAFMTERVRFSSSAWKVYLSSGFSVVGAMSLTYIGAAYINSGMISVLYSLSPIITGVLVMLILKTESLKKMQLFGVLIAIGGLSIVFQSELSIGGDSWKGILLLLGAIFLYAISTVLVKHFDDGLHPLAVNSGSLIISLPFLMLLGKDADYDILISNETVLYATLYLGIVGSFIGFVMYYYVLQAISAIQVMMIPLITPVFALLIGNMVNDEIIATSTLIGSGFVLIGLMVYLLHNNIKSLLRRSRTIA